MYSVLLVTFMWKEEVTILLSVLCNALLITLLFVLLTLKKNNNLEYDCKHYKTEDTHHSNEMPSAASVSHESKERQLSIVRQVTEYINK